MGPSALQGDSVLMSEPRPLMRVRQIPVAATLIPVSSSWLLTDETRPANKRGGRRRNDGWQRR